MWPLSSISDNRGAHCHSFKLRIIPKSLTFQKYHFLVKVQLSLFNRGPVSKGAGRSGGLTPLLEALLTSCCKENCRISLNRKEKAEGKDLTHDSPFSDRRSSSINWIPDLMLGHDCIKVRSNYCLINMVDLPAHLSCVLANLSAYVTHMAAFVCQNTKTTFSSANSFLKVPTWCNVSKSQVRPVFRQQSGKLLQAAWWWWQNPSLRSAKGRLRSHISPTGDIPVQGQNHSHSKLCLLSEVLGRLSSELLTSWIWRSLNVS